MLCTNYNIETDIQISKSKLTIYPSKVEKLVKEENTLPNYLNMDYSVLNSSKGLLYKGQLTSKKYPLSMIEKDIKELLKNKLNYDISIVHVSELQDDDEKFTVLTMELTLDSPDYSKIIDEEYEISEELGLYEKSIILRLV